MHFQMLGPFIGGREQMQLEAIVIVGKGGGYAMTETAFDKNKKARRLRQEKGVISYFLLLSMENYTSTAISKCDDDDMKIFVFLGLLFRFLSSGFPFAPYPVSCHGAFFECPNLSSDCFAYFPAKLRSTHNSVDFRQFTIS